VNIHDLSGMERPSITAFLYGAAAKGYLGGDVLDFGCGQQPYRGIVEDGGGVYHPYDRQQFGGNVSRRDVGPDPREASFDAILCTQVIQYVAIPALFPTVTRFAALLRTGGRVVMTYPTTWPEIRDDLTRFTRHGMESLLTAAGFRVVLHEQRAAIPFDGFDLPLGYGIVAALP
jgi:hypothetical protein